MANRDPDSDDFDLRLLEVEKAIKENTEKLAYMKKLIRGLAAWPDPNIDLKHAAQMKGVHYGSLTGVANYWKRPRGGEPDLVINNRDYWRPETILEWILLDDTELKLRHLYRRIP